MLEKQLNVSFTKPLLNRLDKKGNKKKWNDVQYVLEYIQGCVRQQLSHTKQGWPRKQRVSSLIPSVFWEAEKDAHSQEDVNK